jgi:hypothetical protein
MIQIHNFSTGNQTTNEKKKKKKKKKNCLNQNGSREDLRAFRNVVHAAFRRRLANINESKQQTTHMREKTGQNLKRTENASQQISPFFVDVQGSCAYV